MTDLSISNRSQASGWIDPAGTAMSVHAVKLANDHLDDLEAEGIHILREAVAERKNPVLLFSGGKDSAVVLRLAEKAFRPGRFPFPLMHVDTGHNFEEVIAYRDARVAELGERLIVASVEESIRTGRVRLADPAGSRNAAQSITLLDAIKSNGFDCCFGGARRDEEKARAKERVFSVRDRFGRWDPRNQRPELWNLWNARVSAGGHLRVFPISNWTELDVWQYIAREQIALPTLYRSHLRDVVRRDGRIIAVTDVTPAESGEQVERIPVRFRTVGDITCTCPVESTAQTEADIIAETLVSSVTERGATRMDDATDEASMEKRKREGYF